MLRNTVVENGAVMGIPAADPRITVYKGIPYAAPPIGELRFCPPMPAHNWEGTLKADTFGPLAWQERPGLSKDFYSREWHVDSGLPISEDCLHLNIWTPAMKKEEQLPVLIFIFGGGMCCGYPSEMEFDGERLARRGIVVVTINYRLNAFGFLAHPELTAESPNRTSGNYGLLDQQFAIKWVKRNIAAFGGNPEKITVAGQSAGGRSVICQCASPTNKGFFQRAITQSSCGILLGFRQKYPSLQEAEETGIRFLSTLGVKSIAEARELDGEFLMKKAMAFLSDTRWGPIVDGVFLQEDVTDSFVNGNALDIDYMGGSTTDELYLGNPPVNHSDLGIKVWAKNQLKLNRKPAYIYRFGPEIPGDDAGVFHSSDLWFMFETLAKCLRPFTGKHYDLARQMCNYWANFIKAGDPNGNDCTGEPMPEWLPYTSSNPHAIFLSDSIISMDNGETEAEKRVERVLEETAALYWS